MIFQDLLNIQSMLQDTFNFFTFFNSMIQDKKKDFLDMKKDEQLKEILDSDGFSKINLKKQ